MRSSFNLAKVGLALALMASGASMAALPQVVGVGQGLTASGVSSELSRINAQFERGAISVEEFNSLVGALPSYLRRRGRYGSGFVKHRAPGERAHRRWRMARRAGRGGSRS